MFVVIHFLRVCVILLTGTERCKFYRLFIPVLPLEIQLSRWEGWDPVNRFNPTPSVCLSQATTWISNDICRSLFSCSIIRGVVNDGIVDHHSLEILHLINEIGDILKQFSIWF